MLSGENGCYRLIHKIPAQETHSLVLWEECALLLSLKRARIEFQTALEVLWA
jgi:hypothetical protein